MIKKPNGLNLKMIFFYLLFSFDTFRQGSYHLEYTPSRPIWQVKQGKAQLVLGSETSWES